MLEVWTPSVALPITVTCGLRSTWTVDFPQMYIPILPWILCIGSSCGNWSVRLGSSGMSHVKIVNSWWGSSKSNGAQRTRRMCCRPHKPMYNSVSGRHVHRTILNLGNWGRVIVRSVEDTNLDKFGPQHGVVVCVPPSVIYWAALSGTFQLLYSHQYRRD